MLFLHVVCCCFLPSSLLRSSHYWTQFVLQCILASSVLAYIVCVCVFFAGCISISKFCIISVTILFLAWKGYNRVWSTRITTKVLLCSNLQEWFVVVYYYYRPALLITTCAVLPLRISGTVVISRSIPIEEKNLCNLDLEDGMVEPFRVWHHCKSCMI